MIGILSKEKLESSTEDVIDWLDYFNANYIRVNGEYFFQNILFENGHLQIENLNNINIYWFRRWINDEYLKEFLEKGNLNNTNSKLLCRNF